MKKWVAQLAFSLLWAGLTTWFLLWLNTRYGFTGKWFFPSVLEFIHAHGYVPWKILFVTLTPLYYISKLYENLNAIVFGLAKLGVKIIMILLVLGFIGLVIHWLTT